MEERLSQTGLLKDLLALLENIAIAVETPDRRKEREKTVEADDESDAGTDDSSGTDERPRSIDPPAAEVDRLRGTDRGSIDVLGKIGLKAGAELDELAVSCLGAVSAMLRSDNAMESLSRPQNHGLRVLLELATVTQSR